MKKFFIAVGREAISFFYFLGGLANLTGHTFYWIFVPPFRKDRVFEQAKKAGYDSLLLVSLIAFFIGVI